MISFPLWLLKASIGLTFTHFMYRIFIRKHTNFQLHRLLFLSCILLSLIGPLFNFSILFQEDTPFAQGVLYIENFESDWGFSETSPPILTTKTVEVESDNTDWQLLLGTFYWMGLVVFAFPILSSYFKLFQLINHSNQKIKDNRFTYLKSPNAHTFSAFNFIFVGRELEILSKSEQEVVLSHERIHAKEWHSVDLLLVDLLRVIFWFHPLKNIVKRDIQELHEYIADDKVAKDRHAYSRLILSLHTSTNLRLPIHAFAYSPLKQRIHMLLKEPSSSFGYLWLSSLCALAFLGLISCDFQVNPMSMEHSNILNLQVETEYQKSWDAIQKYLDPNNQPEKNSVNDFNTVGTPTKVSANGKVAEIYFSKSGIENQVLILHHPEGATLHTHLAEIRVKVGQNVEKGDIVGLFVKPELAKKLQIQLEGKEGEIKIDVSAHLKPCSQQQNSVIFIYPLEKVEIVSDWGSRIHPIHKEKKWHFGIDLKAETGTPVIASASGTVVFSKTSEGGYGKHIRLKHEDGFETMYAQLSDMKVEAGQTVKQGEVIGLTGNSGASTGPHLHFEILKDNKRVNPNTYLK
ncbi:MAG: peptidoglycan DD-metalloendopeptidase family protein [Bacteroidota bacterium]